MNLFPDVVKQKVFGVAACPPLEGNSSISACSAMPAIPLGGIAIRAGCPPVEGTFLGHLSWSFFGS